MVVKQAVFLYITMKMNQGHTFGKGKCTTGENMRLKAITAILAALLISGTAHAQNETKGDIRLFQSFFEDAHITPDLYLDTEFASSYYDNRIADAWLYELAWRMGVPLNPSTELHGRLGLVHADPDNGSETSISDLYLGGRHLFIDQETKVSAGGFVTIPTGKEETWQDNFDVGAYTALRHPVSSEVVLTGTIGLIFTEKYSRDHETTLRLAGGAIYDYSSKVSFLGEAVIETRYDYILLSGGIDYKFDRKSSLRCGLGVGVDDGAPDIQVLLSFFWVF